MRLVVQRVARASVRVAGETIGQIGRGGMVLVGIGHGDDATTVERMADRLIGLRYFADVDGRTNLAAADIGAGILVVSQFTLYADVTRGRRPGFSGAATPDQATPLLDRFVTRLREAGLVVETGSFGSQMEVELVNDGPFTLILDSDRDLPSA